ncbi:ABC-type transport auxiliary lipoprotein family protein [Asticcacaulis sp. EMRT-3]|uniref:ABC-type transport auxiliary lipoprotein family protein n=1 Tax=Asticcacaulis sp. EMRT-3 TaxID=3040349 RepID=UPI0024AED691|nr:ABC-type transport auxiliary lipoprotein family protein [Asticcacaulis sp. EMRT-3]MDI7774862.1 ABC-type transport auxiliary lipoprotein family protein [Asticcacaulis sp. EMRT-3]
MRAVLKTCFVAIAVGGAALSLSGCVNLLPKVKPVQLYRFGYQPDLPDKSGPSGKGDQAQAPDTSSVTMPVGMILGGMTFPPASAGDQVLTVEGNEVAYVGQARWAATAESMFKAAVGDGFARSGGTVALEPRGPSDANYRLDLTVRRFEADYSHNRPTVSIGVDARIIRLSDRSVVGQRYVSAEVPLRHNDMSLIADGFNQATTRVVAGLIAFSQEALAGAALPPTPVTPQTAKGQKVEGL